MNTTEILSKLERVDFTTNQTRTIAEILEDTQGNLATKDDIKPLATRDGLQVVTHGLQAEIYRAKYDLVRWIVGGIIANGVIAALLKYFD